MEENNDVPIEEVNKVIEESKDEEESEDTEGYVDLTEDAAKKELDTMIVPETSEDAEDLINSNVDVNQTKTNIKPINMVKPIPMNLLQFQCECNFKSYVNLDDEKIRPLPEIIKCLNCGKKKSVKKRILNIILTGYSEYERKEEEPLIDEELKE